MEQAEEGGIGMQQTTIKYKAVVLSLRSFIPRFGEHEEPEEQEPCTYAAQ